MRKRTFSCFICLTWAVTTLLPGTVHASQPLPERLSGTGFFSADKRPYSPQYPLWSDGAAKQRWIALPPGTAIDGQQPDAWRFPVGTRLWKQIGFSRPVETRYLMLDQHGHWQYATYVWNQTGTDAVRAPADGIAALAVPDAPEGRYDIPSTADCANCHEAAPAPILGFSALQLSPQRDPLAPHQDVSAAEDLNLLALVTRGWLRRFPAQYLAPPPQINIASPQGRAALGYLHANCGHCHNASGPLASLDLNLQQAVAQEADSTNQTLTTLLQQDSLYRGDGSVTGRVVPGAPDASLIMHRMGSRNPNRQMPPLGTRQVDEQALQLLRQWIASTFSPVPSSQEQNP